MLPPDLVQVGPGGKIDPGVLLGYAPERPVESRRLVVGVDARIRSGSVLYGGTTVGDRLQTGHNAIIREENVLGDDVALWSNSVIDYGCSIGHRVKIHTNVYVPQFTTLGNDVFLAPGCSFANDRFPGCPQAKDVMKGPTLEAGVQVGVNVTILPGVHIGRLSLIGSGAVVTKDVPPGSVVWGNPASVHGSVDDLRCCDGLPDCPFHQYQKRI